MSSTVTVTLPTGLWIHGVNHRMAELRAVTGRDEELILDAAHSMLPAHRTTLQLTNCLTRLGSVDKITSELVRMLTIGDRETLLLNLRRLTFGDSLPCSVDCPSPTCNEKMDVTLKVSDLLLQPYSNSQTLHEVTIKQTNTCYRVRFRLPTGADQEEAAMLAITNPDAAANTILNRCVELITHENDEHVDTLPPIVADKLPDMMAERDPRAELRLNLSCPNCNYSFSAIFDTARYFFEELAWRSKRLHKEAHLLAFHYHWSEAEIMSMTSEKRRMYLELLEDELKEQNSA